MKPSINIIRYKKDFRVQDHAPLREAIITGLPCIAVYCYEPSIIAHPTYSPFHHQAISQSLNKIKISLQNLGISLFIFYSEVNNILQLFNKYFTIYGIYSHEEIGNSLTYERDKHIIKRCEAQTIPLYEYPTNGVVRRLKSRDERDRIRKFRMTQPTIKITPGDYQGGGVTLPDSLHPLLFLPQNTDHYPIQSTGEAQGHQLLKSFLDTRYTSYLYHVGRPHESHKSCSRLSVHLTYGNLTIKQVYQASQQKKKTIQAEIERYHYGTPVHTDAKSRLRHLKSFISRLHRHDHFIQKFESEIDYEIRNLHPYYDRIRTTPNTERLERFEAGMTGFPLIDAAIRCMKSTGWINFRLRATLVSFICNTCLQDWKRPSAFMARYWTDYEPGIHYPQFQMQSGTAGINQYRIYNPTKQMIEKDPEGKFVDQRCPELNGIPMPYKAEPWKLNEGLFQGGFKVRLGVDYPLPLFDLEDQNRIARTILRDLKKQEGFKEIANQIYLKHGSRMKQRNGSNK